MRVAHPTEQRSIDPSNLEPNRKRQKTGGRKKGSTNKATRDIKALAQKYTPEALQTLVSVMSASDSDAARVNAAKEILDRGYGRPSQTHEVELSANAQLLALIEGRLGKARGAA